VSRVEIVLSALGVKVEKVRGRRGWARCPYHEDTTPTNFFIRLSGDYAGSCHCFSCKQGGSLTDLVMHVRSCDYVKAKEFISDLGKNYEPPRARVRVEARRAMIGVARFKLPDDIYFEPLETWVSGARKYASGRCQITHEEVELYGLGYAVDGNLAGRVVIPWRGANGAVGGYSARTFVGEEPKYKTPAESEKPDNSIMFGEHLWSKTRDTLVVTEGALNAMAVRRAIDDFKFDVAAMGGSEIFPLQVIKMSTFKRVVIMTDSDPAGDKAAAALTSVLGKYSQTVRMRLPDKKDALDVGRDYLRVLLVPTFTSFGVTPARSAS
jgi:DNA primase